METTYTYKGKNKKRDIEKFFMGVFSNSQNSAVNNIFPSAVDELLSRTIWVVSFESIDHPALINVALERINGGTDLHMHISYNGIKYDITKLSKKHQGERAFGNGGNYLNWLVECGVIKEFNSVEGVGHVNSFELVINLLNENIAFEELPQYRSYVWQTTALDKQIFLDASFDWIKSALYLLGIESDTTVDSSLATIESIYKEIALNAVQHAYFIEKDIQFDLVVKPNKSIETVFKNLESYYEEFRNRHIGDDVITSMVVKL